MITGNDYAQFWVEDDILHFVYKPNSLIDLEAARALVRDRLRFQNGVFYPILCDIRLLKTANKAAREYLANHGCINALAVALLIEEEYSGALSKVFIRISNPGVPTREFTSITAALNFLYKFR